MMAGHLRSVPGAAQCLAIAVTVVGCIVAGGILLLAGMHVRPDHALGELMLTGGLLAAYAAFAWRRLSQRAIMLCGGLGLISASSLAAGVIAHASLRLKRPWVDSTLLQFDRLLGLDTPGLVAAFAPHPAMARVLAVAYSSTVPVVVLSAAALALAGSRNRMWPLLCGFAGGMVVSALLYALWPALGNMAHAGIHPPGLPAHAGVFHLNAVAYYRTGSSDLVDFDRFSGIITFPSFHTVMALLVGHAWRGIRVLGPLAALWAALVIVSTIPIGGHYVVDLIGGLILWLAFVAAPRWTARLFERRAAPLSAS